MIGVGTQKSPFIIESVSDFLTVENNLSASYVLDVDIDLTGVQFAGIGSFLSPFSGSFDGNRHVISGLSIANSDSNGLFNYTKNAHIKNLEIAQSTLQSSPSTGSLIGEANKTIVENVKAVSTIEGVEGDEHVVGGIVGKALNKTLVQSCHSKLSFYTVEHSITAGGVVGESNNSAIVQSFYSGEITSQGEVGGVVGKIIDSHILDCLYTGNGLTSTTNAGGMVGMVEGINLIEESYVAASAVAGCNNFAGNSGNGVIEYKNCQSNLNGQDRSGSKVLYNEEPTVRDSELFKLIINHGDKKENFIFKDNNNMYYTIRGGNLVETTNPEDYFSLLDLKRIYDRVPENCTIEIDSNVKDIIRYEATTINHGIFNSLNIESDSKYSIPSNTKILQLNNGVVYKYDGNWVATSLVPADLQENDFESFGVSVDDIDLSVLVNTEILFISSTEIVVEKSIPAKYRLMAKVPEYRLCDSNIIGGHPIEVYIKFEYDAKPTIKAKRDYKHINCRLTKEVL